jgi:TRAP-type mannitol/chloroaromatic compound transport system permease small subunit
MQKVLLGIDKLSTFVGHAFSWLIVALTALMTWEIFSRRFFDSPHAWTFDAQIQLYGFLFMASGAYTLSKAGMVRGDVIYGFLPDRVQAGIDLVLYICFFVPGIVALTYAGWIYAGESWAIRERSTIMSNGPPLYWFKSVIPFAGALMGLQGLVEIARCILCLRTGEWPSRQEDVEEVDVDKLKKMVHVRDEDIDKLDAIVVEQQKAAGKTVAGSNGEGA